MSTSHVSQYYADDKDLFDLFSSSRFTAERLRNIAAARGIYISPKENPKKIVAFLQRIPVSWPELSVLINEADSPDSHEHLTTHRIETPVKDFTGIAKAANEIIQQRRSTFGEESAVRIVSKDRLEVTVKYSEFNFQKTRVRQRQEKDLTIIVDLGNGMMEVRHEDNKRGRDIVEAIVANFENQPEKPVTSRRSIDLSGIKSAAIRTKFFMNLMEEIDGFELEDLTDVKVERLFPDDSAINKQEIKEEEREKKATEARLKKARFSGTGLLMSPEYIALLKSDFYICRVAFECIEDNSESLVEFSAEFSNSTDASGFRYDVRGVYEKRDDGKYKSTKSVLTPKRRSELNRRLESAAYASLEKVSVTDTPSKQ